jgi:drug/metabolite transporter (DMT)-like permease
MTPNRIVAIILIVLGVGALAMGGFSYTKETHEAKIGPLQLQVKEKETVNLPQWLGIGAIAVGVLLLIVPGGRK